MATREPADKEEEPNFSLGLEFLTPEKEPNEKEKREQTKPVSSRFATLSESEMENIIGERHSGRTKKVTNWSVGTFKGKYFHFIFL